MKKIVFILGKAALLCSASLIAPVTLAMTAESGLGQKSAMNPQLQWSRGISPLIHGKSSSPSNRVESLNFPAMSMEAGMGSARITSLQADKRKWSIQIQDKTLYRTMRRWAQEADYQLLWQVDKDFPIEANVEFNSTLREALEQVMAGVALTDYPIQAIYNSTAKVLRVVRYMDDGRR